MNESFQPGYVFIPLFLFHSEILKETNSRFESLQAVNITGKHFGMGQARVIIPLQF
jgi:hypothetical protein